MIKFEKSMFINRPQQEVFDFATDPANAHKWQSAVKSEKWTSEGPHGVGSTRHVVISGFLGRDTESDLEYTIWDPPNEFYWKGVNGPFPMEIGAKCEPKGNGTQVTVFGQVEPGGFFKLAEGLVKKQIESQMDSDFEALKQMLEAVPEKTS